MMGDRSPNSAIGKILSYLPLGLSPPSMELRQFLADRALSEILARAKPILGQDDGPNRPWSDWMSSVPDSTRIVNMSIPGTHDSATWDYSQDRQDELKKYTGNIPSAVFFHCQERSLVQSLNDGVRAFDLRVAYNPGNDTIGFWHGTALLGPTSTLQDILFGLYAWLLAHPTETVLVSINYEEGSKTVYDKKFEELLFATLNNDAGKKFWFMPAGKLGTLGQARGKLILLQRFTYKFLDASAMNPFGIHLGADHWTANGGDIHLVYNEKPRRVAYIEDKFKPQVPPNSGAETTISSKFDAVVSHLNRAIDGVPHQPDVEEGLYITFSSAFADYESESPLTPNIIALGTKSTSGMNERLHSWISERKGVRFGVILMDFYHSEPNLVRGIITRNPGFS
ncbi:unnamed protein product [Mycena citricolor]|uniref:PLC-like phosphodiesterase n=1 Tax=Mycena citricolor TaxID=2018698 RepID=A0AAD2HKR4_9AGAR|nr:unnamed protein product [Mycena citricolor]